jgi:hypothetical protein
MNKISKHKKRELLRLWNGKEKMGKRERIKRKNNGGSNTKYIICMYKNVIMKVFTLCNEFTLIKTKKKQEKMNQIEEMIEIKII